MKEVEETITAEESLRCTYKLIFKQDLKEIREWQFYTKGRANADGKIPFPNSLDPLLSVLTGHIFDETKRSQVKTIKNIDSTIHSFMYC